MTQNSKLGCVSVTTTSLNIELLPIITEFSPLNSRSRMTCVTPMGEVNNIQTHLKQPVKVASPIPTRETFTADAIVEATGQFKA